MLAGAIINHGREEQYMEQFVVIKSGGLMFEAALGVAHAIIRGGILWRAAGIDAPKCWQDKF